MFKHTLVYVDARTCTYVRSVHTYAQVNTQTHYAHTHKCMLKFTCTLTYSTEYMHICTHKHTHTHAFTVTDLYKLSKGESTGVEGD